MGELQDLTVAVARVEERQEHTLDLLRRLEEQLPPIAIRVDSLERDRIKARAWAAGAAATVGAVISILGRMFL